jgi:ATP-dependent RNA helicase SUPV3L1/SUV3
MRPRLRLIADDHLSGPPREAVQARLDLWLKTHIERMFAPLFALAAAEDVTGISRGIAFQLIEAIGVLERQRVAEEVKGLDQPSRATLRKYGVRFGAYHIFFPALLKPGARTLASLLWALKQDDVDMNALGGAQHLAASGRTSFPADKALSQDAYRVLGYKLAGERAVRVDILERLADLIRPALSWRPGTGMEKPAGAFDGRSFTVTQAMTSLTGSAGEDFASVLRSLGYRMDRRAPLPEEPKPVEASAAAASENEAPVSQTDAAPEAAAETAAVETAPVEAEAAAEAAADVASASKLPEVAFAPADAAEQTETATEAAPAAEASHADTTTVSEDASPSSEAAAVTAPAEPELVEVWRPAGRHDERRPKHDRNRHHHHRRPSHAAAPEAGAAAEAGEKTERPGGQRRHNRDRGRDDRKPRPEGEGAQARGPREERGDRPHQRFKGKGKFEGKRDGRDRKDSGPAFRTFATSAPRERERVADPNSPFAKLAALKDQLGNRKD